MTSAFRLEGSSMLPVFRPGEVVLVGPPVLSRGDCAVYNYGGRTLLHRVLKTSPEGVCLADDAGRLAPHSVPWADIRGKALSKNVFAGGFPGYIYSRLRRAISPLST